MSVSTAAMAGLANYSGSSSDLIQVFRKIALDHKPSQDECIAFCDKLEAFLDNQEKLKDELYKSKEAEIQSCTEKLQKTEEKLRSAIASLNELTRITDVLSWQMAFLRM